MPNPAKFHKGQVVRNVKSKEVGVVLRPKYGSFDLESNIWIYDVGINDGSDVERWAESVCEPARGTPPEPKFHKGQLVRRKDGRHTGFILHHPSRDSLDVDGEIGAWVYDVGLFDGSVVERWTESVCELVAGGWDKGPEPMSPYEICGFRWSGGEVIITVLNENTGERRELTVNPETAFEVGRTVGYDPRPVEPEPAA